MEENQIKTAEQLLIIGGSAGSLDVLLKILPLLDQQLSIAIIIVVHRRSSPGISLADLLDAKTKLKVKEADDKDAILKGYIYLAPADYHLLIESNFTLALDYSEKINYSRPSIDVTFETAADVYKERLTCLLMSGANNDGTEGLKKVKAAGGKVWIQNPLDAEVPYMPISAMNAMEADAILNESIIAEYINKLDRKLQ